MGLCITKMTKQRQHNLLGNNVHVVDRKHPHLALEARPTFALVACFLTPNPSSRIPLQATPKRACEGERDVAIASTLLLALENCLYAGQDVGEVWVELVVIFYFACMWVSGEWVFDTAAVEGGGRTHTCVHTTRIVHVGPSTLPYYHLTRGDYQVPGSAVACRCWKEPLCCYTAGAA